MNQAQRQRATLVTLGLTLLLSSVPLAAVGATVEEEPTGHRGFMAANGRVSYNVYCSNCHGPEGQGKGNLAQYLTVPPSDLTRLMAMNDGVFPAELVTEVIDGRREVRGHGRMEMPIWGDVFQHSLADKTPTPDESGEDRAQRKISELVLYLETIQIDQPAEGAGEE